MNLFQNEIEQQAVLEGRKTQTRRIMNPQPEDCSTVHRWHIGRTNP